MKEIAYIYSPNWRCTYGVWKLLVVVIELIRQRNEKVSLLLFPTETCHNGRARGLIEPASSCKWKQLESNCDPVRVRLTGHGEPCVYSGRKQVTIRDRCLIRIQYWNTEIVLSLCNTDNVGEKYIRLTRFHGSKSLLKARNSSYLCETTYAAVPTSSWVVRRRISIHRLIRTSDTGWVTAQWPVAKAVGADAESAKRLMTRSK